MLSSDDQLLLTQTVFDFADECRPYSTKDAAVASDLTVRQLDYWDREKYFIPSLIAANGQGSRRSYSFSDVVQLRFIGKLLHDGWTLRESFEAHKSCRAILQNPSMIEIEDAMFIREGKKLLAVFKTTSGKRLLVEAAKAGGQQVMEIVIEVLQEEALEQLSRLK